MGTHIDPASSRPHWFDRWLPRISMMVLISIGLAFLWRLVFTVLLQTVSIGGTASGSLEQANDQIVQLTQWVIATVLLVGGSLVGLNWYQSERRYQGDRKNDTALLQTFGQSVANLDERVLTLEKDRLEVRHTLERAQRLLDYLDVANEMNSADRFIEFDQRIQMILEKYATSDHGRRLKLATYLAEMMDRESQSLIERAMGDITFATNVENAFDDAITTIAPNFPEISTKLTDQLNQLKTLASISRRQRAT